MGQHSAYQTAFKSLYLNQSHETEPPADPKVNHTVELTGQTTRNQNRDNPKNEQTTNSNITFRRLSMIQVEEPKFRAQKESKGEASGMQEMRATNQHEHLSSKYISSRKEPLKSLQASHEVLLPGKFSNMIEISYFKDDEAGSPHGARQQAVAKNQQLEPAASKFSILLSKSNSHGSLGSARSPRRSNLSTKRRAQALARSTSNMGLMSDPPLLKSSPLQINAINVLKDSNQGSNHADSQKEINNDLKCITEGNMGEKILQILSQQSAGRGPQREASRMRFLMNASKGAGDRTRTMELKEATFARRPEPAVLAQNEEGGIKVPEKDKPPAPKSIMNFLQVNQMNFQENRKTRMSNVSTLKQKQVTLHSRIEFGGHSEDSSTVQPMHDIGRSTGEINIKNETMNVIDGQFRLNDKIINHNNVDVESLLRVTKTPDIKHDGGGYETIQRAPSHCHVPAVQSLQHSPKSGEESKTKHFSESQNVPKIIIL